MTTTTARTIMTKLPKVKLFLESIERNSRRSRTAYSCGLLHLSNFISDKYAKYDWETILQPLSENKINIYEMLEGFISYLYYESYHNISAGINELTSKITCCDNPSNITSKYYSVNVTGS